MSYFSVYSYRENIEILRCAFLWFLKFLYLYCLPLNDFNLEKISTIAWFIIIRVKNHVILLVDTYRLVLTWNSELENKNVVVDIKKVYLALI